MSETLITFLASFLIWFMFGAVIYLSFVNKKFTTKQVAHGMAAAFFAWGVSELLKTAFPTTRPFISEGLQPLTFTVPLDGAFPSTHAAISFGLAAGLWTYDKKMGGILFIAAILVSLGRILSNVHYFIDVFGGAYLGVVSAFLINRVISPARSRA